MKNWPEGTVYCLPLIGKAKLRVGRKAIVHIFVWRAEAPVQKRG
jgi:hypothetical protein